MTGEKLGTNVEFIVWPVRRRLRFWLWYKAWWDILNATLIALFGLAVVLALAGDMFVHGHLLHLFASSDNDTASVDRTLTLLGIWVSGATAIAIWLLGLGQQRWVAINRIRFLLEELIHGQESAIKKLVAGQKLTRADTLRMTLLNDSFLSGVEASHEQSLEVHADTQRHLEAVRSACHMIRAMEHPPNGRSAIERDETANALRRAFICSSLALLYLNKNSRLPLEMLRALVGHQQTEFFFASRSEIRSDLVYFFPKAKIRS